MSGLTPRGGALPLPAGPTFLDTSVFSAGSGFSIDVDSRQLTSLVSKLESLSRTAAAQFDRFMAAEVGKTTFQIQLAWPVDTGRSQGLGIWQNYGWQWQRVSAFNYVILNPQDYTKWVHRKGQKGVRVVDTLVKPLVNDLIDDLETQAKIWVADVLASSKLSTPALSAFDMSGAAQKAIDAVTAATAQYRAAALAQTASRIASGEITPAQ